MDNDKPLITEVITDSSRWGKFTTFLKKISVATGQGLVYLYKTVDTNKHLLLPIINGLVGDGLASVNHTLAINMSFRENGRDVTVKELNLHNRKVAGGQHICVFVHGLMGDEKLWQSSATAIGHATLLEKDLTITPLYVRYNSGLHISDNGKSLNRLLQELVEVYGDKINKITLIGYSMGGLVVRSTGYYANKQQQNWLKKLTSVVLLSVPNDGSYLEQAGHLTAWILRTIPNIPTRLIAQAIDKRSNGIKDLRHGFMVEEDWQSPHYDNLLQIHRTPIRPLPNVTYHVIAGTIAENEMSLIAWFFGDGLVGKHSALGKASVHCHIYDPERVTCKIFPKTNHLTILSNSEVYQYLKSALA